MKTFTEEQVKLVKELLAKQRENCLLAWANSETDRDTLISLANALEPPLPSPVEQEPIGYVNKNYMGIEGAVIILIHPDQYNCFSEVYKDSHMALYAQPQITWPDEEKIWKEFEYEFTGYRIPEQGVYVPVFKSQQKVRDVFQWLHNKLHGGKI